MPKTYEPIATTTLGSATASVTFSSISGSYTDLLLVIQAKTTDANSSRLNGRYNSDTGNNYSYVQLSGDGSTASSARISNFSILDFGGYPSISNTRQAQGIIHIQSYSNTNVNKTTLIRFDDAGAESIARVGLWRNNDAITTISMSFNAGNIDAGSTFTLYGIKAA